MIKFVLTSGLALLVPVFGLLSCTKDQSSSPDTWSAGAFVVSGSSSWKFSSASSRTLGPDAAIQFSGDHWSTLDVTTTCSPVSAGAKSDAFASFNLPASWSETYHLSGFRTAIPLNQLWPQALWSKLPLDLLAQTRCDFSFVASDDAGSTVEGLLRDIQLTAFAADTAELKAQQVVRASALDLGKFATDTSPSSKLSLICGLRSASVSSDALDSSSLDTLMKKINFDSSFVGAQPCHLVLAPPQIAREPVAFRMSPEVQLKFSNVALNVAYDFAVQRSRIFRDVAYAQVTITNPNPVSTYLFVPSAVPNVRSNLILVGTPASENQGVTYELMQCSDSLSLPLRLEVDGRAISPQVYLLEPGASMTARLVFVDSQEVDRIARMRPSMPPLFLNADVLGADFSLENPFVISQIDSPADQAGTLAAQFGNARVVFKGGEQFFGPDLTGIAIQKSPTRCF